MNQGRRRLKEKRFESPRDVPTVSVSERLPVASVGFEASVRGTSREQGSVGQPTGSRFANQSILQSQSILNYKMRPKRRGAAEGMDAR